MKDLFGALAKARAAIHGVVRDGRNNQQGYNYASAEAMMAVAGPALADNGLSVFPQKYTPDFDAMMLHVEYVLAHASGESLPISSSTPMVVTKFKSGAETPPDKALGAAKTYDLRYMLRGLLNIPQVEKDADVDQRPDGEHRPQPKKPSPPVSTKPSGDIWVRLEKAAEYAGGRDDLMVKIGWLPSDWPTTEAEAVEALQGAIRYAAQQKKEKEAGRAPSSVVPPDITSSSPEEPDPPPLLMEKPPEEKAANSEPAAKQDPSEAARNPADGPKSATETRAPAQAGQTRRLVTKAELHGILVRMKTNAKGLAAAINHITKGKKKTIDDLGPDETTDLAEYLEGRERDVKERVKEGLR